MVPPVVLADQSAECVLTGVDQRSRPWLWREQPCKQVLVLTPDSHKALIRLAMHFAAFARQGLPLGNCPATSAKMSLHARCMVHLGFAAVTALIKQLDIVNGTFCATHLLHRGQSQQWLRSRVRQLIRERLAFQYESPDPPDFAANRALLQVLEKVDEERGPRQTVFHVISCANASAHIIAL